jgi:glycosyltransferase involved in cell wall biosynthesis
MGFAETQIWRGSLSCDVSEFQQVHDAGRTADNRKFLFVGRLVPEKGITALAAGYKEYRKASREPWPLYASGTGPLQHCLEGIPGVTCTGFLQSAQLAEVFRDSSCLVLPSSFEPWGIVIHEAATAGLSVICSSECGASVHLVQDGYNGFIIPSGDANSVAAALMRFSSLPAERRREMANASAALALQFSPERWASTVLEHASRIQAREYFRG